MSKPSQNTSGATEQRATRGGLRNGAFAGGAVFAAAAAGSVGTEPDGAWFRSLDKPSWQPPDAAFPIVWTSLYADIAVTSAAVLNELERRGELEEAAEYRKALTTNLAMNTLWSWLFFRWHHLGASALGAGVLAANCVQLARRAGRVKPGYGAALAPYALWTSFATVLGTVIWWRNRERR